MIEDAGSRAKRDLGDSNVRRDNTLVLVEEEARSSVSLGRIRIESW